MKCCELTPGMLRHSITWQEEVKTPDSGGGYSKTWQDVATDKAMVKPLRGNERWQSQRIESNITHRIFMRYKANRLPSMRIVFKSRIFQVKAILNIEERNRWYEIEAIEGEAT